MLKQLTTLLAAALLLSACKESEIPPQVVRPAQVWVVGENPVSSSASFSGEIRARNEADLAFRVGGKVQNRTVNLGDAVQAGQVLARLDTQDLKLGLASARAALAAAEADFKNARSELTRIKDLYAKKFVGRSALDSAQAAHDAAAARASSARAQVNISDNQAGYTELRAEKAGVITQVNVEVGQVVAAGASVLHIAYEGEREVHVRVGESTVQALPLGAAVNVTLWSQPQQPLQGQVREVAPGADASSSFLVKVSLLQPPADLRLGITANVSLPDVASSSGAWLPSTALFQDADKAAVWVLDAEGKVQLKPVEVLGYFTQGVSVSGLAAGEKVIAAGVHKLYAGQQVNAVAYNGKAGS